MKDIRKIVLVVIVFVAGVLTIDQLVGLFFTHIRQKLPNDGERVAKSEYIMNRMNSDVIIVGSSKAQCHYDCEVIQKYYPSMSVYNCGVDGQRFFYTAASLLHILERYSPKVIIWEIADFGPDYSEDLSLLYPYYYSDKEIKNVLDYKDSSLKYVLWINSYKYNGTASRIIRSLFVKDPDTQGYKALKKHSISKEISHESQSVFGNDTIQLITDSKKIELFNNIVATCKNRKICLYIVQSPKLREGSDCFVKRICNENGVSFFDFAEDINYRNNENYWYDMAHLNDEGAKKFTNDLMQRFVRLHNNND